MYLQNRQEETARLAGTLAIRSLLVRLHCVLEIQQKNDFLQLYYFKIFRNT